MKKVIVASENPVKIQVAEKVFTSVFPNEDFEFVGVKAISGVPDQPMEEEARLGAKNRLDYIRENYKGADFYIAIEAGLFEDRGRLSNRAWITISDKSGFTAESSTSSFYLPKKVEEYVQNGVELGLANDSFFKTVNSKHGLGAVGHLTDGFCTRVDYYLQPAIIALSEIKHRDWF